MKRVKSKKLTKIQIYRLIIKNGGSCSSKETGDCDVCPFWKGTRGHKFCHFNLFENHNQFIFAERRYLKAKKLLEKYNKIEEILK